VWLARGDVKCLSSIPADVDYGALASVSIRLHNNCRSHLRPKRRREHTCKALSVLHSLVWSDLGVVC
jgi:hypothetical protein